MKDELEVQLMFDRPLDVSSLKKYNKDILIVEVIDKEMFRSVSTKNGYQILSNSSIVNFAEVERQIPDDSIS